jgi:hypothetical protein
LARQASPFTTAGRIELIRLEILSLASNERALSKGGHQSAVGRLQIAPWPGASAASGDLRSSFSV